MQRLIQLMMFPTLILGLFALALLAQPRAAHSAGLRTGAAPFDEPVEPMPPEPQMLFMPTIGHNLGPVCVAVESPAVALSPLRPTPVQVQIITQYADEVDVGGTSASVDADGVAVLNLAVFPDQVYEVRVDGLLAPACTFSFEQLPSWWVGQHGDPYAWVGRQHWVEVEEGLIQLFTSPTVDVVLPLEFLTATEENRARWTYFVQYASPNIHLYSSMLRPGNAVYQHVHRVVLRTPDNRVLRINDIGHVTRPVHLGPLNVDTGPDTEVFVWEEGEQLQLNGFGLEFVRSRTHNGIHEAVLVTIPEDDSEWIFTRELNGHGAFISGRIDGRLFADSIAEVGGVFGSLLRDEELDPTEFVVGVVRDNMPGQLEEEADEPQVAAAAVEFTVLDSEQWPTIVELFGDDW